MKKKPTTKAPAEKAPVSPRSGNSRAHSADSSKRKPTADGNASGPPADVQGSRFPIVGVGASAGGLEAFSQLLRHLPADTGMAFVLVQHLDPTHKSSLADLLSRATTMPVCEAVDRMKVEPNHVYVIPPDRLLSFGQGRLTLQPRPTPRTLPHSIDFLLESISREQKEAAIGVILSGAANDGTIGLEAIKSEGGITFAQDASAKYDSMPRSAIAAGCVDFVLSPRAIAAELSRIARHPYLHSQNEEEETPAAESAVALPPSPGPGRARGVLAILGLLRERLGVDFAAYKPSTIHRRITRRMVLSRSETIDSYAGALRDDEKELDALYCDILIGVTSFFRNSDAYDALQEKAFPLLLPADRIDPVRVWVAGCSSGQEAYSLAIALLEHAERSQRAAPALQIFGTDLNEVMLSKARHGLYAKSMVADLSPERLQRYFVEEERGYRVNKLLRDACVFARHNLMEDPPFSRMDLISCRNLLIYLDADLQQRILPTFHYALKPGGVLFLGASESIGSHTNLFQAEDRKQKFYTRKATFAPALKARLPLRYTSVKRRPDGAAEDALAAGTSGAASAQREADRLTILHHAPPAVLIDSDLKIVQFRGATDVFLEPPSGKAEFSLLKMARKGLMIPLRNLITQVRSTRQPARSPRITFTRQGETRRVTLEVTPLNNLRDPCYLVSFEDAAAESVEPTKPAGGPVVRTRAAQDFDRAQEQTERNVELERELVETRDYLQSLQEEHEAAHGEIQASSEELQSGNEELQSINEELETSKEELESANEELITVNDEMGQRNVELTRLNTDLSNLQVSMNKAIIVVGLDLTVWRFTAPAEKPFNLLPADVGRRITDIRHNIVFPELEATIGEVAQTGVAQEREVRDHTGRHFVCRITPYLTLERTITGAVLILDDVDARIRAEQQVAGARDYAEAILRSARDPLVILEADLRVKTANQSFYQTFHSTAEQTEGQSIFALGNGQWANPRLRELLENVLPLNTQFDDLEIVHPFPVIGFRTMLLSLRKLKSQNSDGLIVLSIEDITLRKQTEAALRAAMDNLKAAQDATERASRAKDDFLAALSHELRTPLTPVLMTATSLRDDERLPQDVRDHLSMMERNIALEARLIDDLLDLTAISRGKLQLRAQPCDAHSLIGLALEIVRADATAKAISIEREFAAQHSGLFADPARFQQVIWNLLRNAVKFTPHSGRIKIRTSEEIGPDGALWLRIEVTDSGIGIHPSRLDQVFLPFDQGGLIGDHRFGGLGLGLSIARGVVELHGGRISAQSAGANIGATFVVDLPGAIQPPSGVDDAAAAAAPGDQATAVETSLRLLLVEDHSNTLQTIARLLRRDGHAVTTATTIAEALAAVSGDTFDLVVSDLGLPDGSGNELMAKLRDEHGLRGIALSGYGMEEDLERSRGAGFVFHLVKPVSIADLRRVIRELAGGDA